MKIISSECIIEYKKLGLIRNRWFYRKIKENKDYHIGISDCEYLYLYRKPYSYFPEGIIAGFITRDDNNLKLLILQYIWVNTKRKGIATQFIKELIDKYDIQVVSYSVGSIEGGHFLGKIESYLDQRGIKIISRIKK